MSLRLPPPLVALSPGDLAADATGDFLVAVRRAASAGLAGMLLREPEMSDRVLLALAREIRALLSSGGWLAIHDRVHLADACGADAIHLGFRSLAPKEARAVLRRDVGPGNISIGFSAHAEDDPGLASGADYLFFGPVLDTPSKRGRKEPIGFEGLAAGVTRSPTPLWAIGGLLPQHVRRCLDAGAAGIAVRAGIFSAPDPAAATAAFLRALAATP